ncbi:hypothetical protein [Aggregatibacter sp.]
MEIELLSSLAYMFIYGAPQNLLVSGEHQSFIFPRKYTYLCEQLVFDWLVESVSEVLGK